MLRFSWLHSGLLLLASVSSVVWPSPLRAEDKSAAESKNEKAAPAPAATPAPAASPATSRPLPVRKPSALDLKLRGGVIADAITALEEAIAENPDDMTLPPKRSEIVRRLMAEKKDDQAAEQGQKLVDHFLANLDQPVALFGLFAATQNLVANLDRLDRKPDGTALLDRSLQAVREVPSPSKTATSLAGNVQMLFLRAKAERIAELQGYDQADAFLVAESRQAEEKRSADPAAVDALRDWSRLMETRCDVAAGADKAAEAKQIAAELDTALLAALEANPESAPHLVEFIRVRAGAVSRLSREEPEEASALLEKTVAFLKESKLAEDAAVARSVKSLGGLGSRIEAALALKKLVGQPAPPFDALAWAHGKPLPQDDLRGKVVLVDFWAIWCGPCIATFPHLVELHEQFHDKGLEIVGVTREYGYSWNEEEERAESDKEDATLETELAMLEKFMEYHKLRHPTLVTPKQSGMHKAYGVNGIPHAVVIDRHGVIRLIKVGSGEANAKAIHDMVEKLLKE